MTDIRLLDCTLRDGGYINEWRWGAGTIRSMLRDFVRAGVDIVETGFLKNTDSCDPDTAVCATIEELNRMLPEKKGSTEFCAMAMCSDYDIRRLSDWSGSGISMIRVTAHDYDIRQGIETASEIMKKGYRVSINPINIMGYPDDRILWMIDQVNRIMPWQFSIVDTFGSMKQRDLDRIVSLIDHNLDKSIRIGLHLHENTALSFSLAQSFLRKHLDRGATVDASLMGMGRVPGNLPLELAADYMNEYCGKTYDINFMMDAIQDYIKPLREKHSWGYTPAYFLSARHNLHRNYAEYLLDKGTLTNRDMNHILSRIRREKASVFDPEYAEKLYREYEGSRIDDREDRRKLKNRLRQPVLILAPGSSLRTEKEKILAYIRAEHPAVISLNFIPDERKPEFAFFSNHRRFQKAEKSGCETIVTSNIREEQVSYRIDLNSISGAFPRGQSSLILLLRLLAQLGISQAAVAGADGYREGQDSYFDSSFVSAVQHDRSYNEDVGRALRESGMKLVFITPSEYERYLEGNR